MDPATPAHDFALPDLEGTQVGLSDFRGKVVLLGFFATT
jgi:peroxiredoxin